MVWQRTLSLTLIHRLRPGLDVDVGCQLGVYQPLPARSVLLELTWRLIS